MTHQEQEQLAQAAQDVAAAPDIPDTDPNLAPDDAQEEAPLSADLLLLDSPAGRVESEEDVRLRLARLEGENRALREARQAPEGAPSDPVQTLYREEQQLAQQIRELEANLGDPDDPEQSARYYLQKQDLLDRRLRLQELREQRREQQVALTAAEQRRQAFLEKAARRDPEFDTPGFREAFDRYVTTRIPANMRDNEEVLELAWRDLAYRAMKLQRQRGGARLADGMTPGRGGVQAPKPTKQVPTLSEEQQLANRIWGATEEDYKGQYGSTEDDTFEVPYFKFTHRRG